MDTAQSRPRVLLVDNDVDVAEVQQFFLERRGFDTEHAEDGQRGLEAFVRARDAGRAFAAIVLDLRMPRVDGPAVLEGLRRYADAPPVLIVSGFVDSEQEHSLRANPIVHDVLRKPFDLFHLVAALEDAIASRKKARAESGQQERSASLFGSQAGFDQA